jgi:hypothetical protein
MGGGMKETKVRRWKMAAVAAGQWLHGKQSTSEIARLEHAAGLSGPRTGRARKQIPFSTVTQTVS